MKVRKFDITRDREDFITGLRVRTAGNESVELEVQKYRIISKDDFTFSKHRTSWPAACFLRSLRRRTDGRTDRGSRKEGKEEADDVPFTYRSGGIKKVI